MVVLLTSVVVVLERSGSQASIDDDNEEDHDRASKASVPSGICCMRKKSVVMHKAVMKPQIKLNIPLFCKLSHLFCISFGSSSVENVDDDDDKDDADAAVVVGWDFRRVDDKSSNNHSSLVKIEPTIIPSPKTMPKITRSHMRK